MTINIDKVIKANQELMEEAKGMVGSPFLGPKKIGRAVQVMLHAAALYNDVCMALVAMKGGQDGQGSDQTNEREI